jgi:hypothetical protein
MAVRDEKTFTDEEMIAAFAILLPPDRAREEGLAFNSLPDLQGTPTSADELADLRAHGPRSYDGDVLDLLSLVSESCAARAWAILGLTSEEGERRRNAFRHRLETAIRLRDEASK